MICDFSLKYIDAWIEKERNTLSFFFYKYFPF